MRRSGAPAPFAGRPIRAGTSSPTRCSRARRCEDLDRPAASRVEALRHLLRGPLGAAEHLVAVAGHHECDLHVSCSTNPQRDPVVVALLRQEGRRAGAPAAERRSESSGSRARGARRPPAWTRNRRAPAPPRHRRSRDGARRPCHDGEAEAHRLQHRDAEPLVADAETNTSAVSYIEASASADTPSWKCTASPTPAAAASRTERVAVLGRRARADEVELRREVVGAAEDRERLDQLLLGLVRGQPADEQPHRAPLRCRGPRRRRLPGVGRIRREERRTEHRRDDRMRVAPVLDVTRAEMRVGEHEIRGPHDRGDLGAGIAHRDRVTRIPAGEEPRRRDVVVVDDLRLRTPRRGSRRGRSWWPRGTAARWGRRRPGTPGTGGPRGRGPRAPPPRRSPTRRRGRGSGHGARARGDRSRRDG